MSTRQPLITKPSESKKQCSKGFERPVSDLSVQRAKDLIPSFPTTRYYGSKKRLLPWLYENLKDIPFRSVLDGFGGTASVSLLFKAMGKDVTFNDALMSNVISAKALLSDRISMSEHDFLSFFASIEPTQGFISKTFRGKYYLDFENEWLDGAIQTIMLETEENRNIFLYCLFQACLQKRPFNLFHRANLNLRITKVSQSFGNQKTWDTPFIDLTRRAFLELKKANIPPLSTHTILEPTDVSELENGFDLVYLDPPYINQKNNGDDYLKRYHFLEGLSNYDEWASLIDPNYRTLQFKKQSHTSEWNHKSYFKDRLFNLIEHHKDSIVVLSYVDNAYPSLDELEPFFKDTFKNYKVVSQGLPHALSKGKKNELLFIGRS